VDGHGIVVWPPMWGDPNGTHALKPGEGCLSGIQVSEKGFKGWVSSCLWYTEHTTIPGKATLQDHMRTFKRYDHGVDPEYLADLPWMAPGSAPVEGPCGVHYYQTNGTVQFLEAHKLKYKDVVTTEWKLGSRVEAYWFLWTNHGGGYSYRLCKVPAEGVSGVTEECFQKTPLRFSGDKQWAQYGDDKDNRVYFTANRTDVGTTPEGSQWTQNPIPGCAGKDGVHVPMHSSNSTCKFGPQFEPPLPGQFGLGMTAYNMTMPMINYDTSIVQFQFNIGDYLEVPDDLEPGEYVLSWRWDAEGTQQVFNACASVKLV